jgi:hypothetical protein
MCIHESQRQIQFRQFSEHYGSMTKYLDLNDSMKIIVTQRHGVFHS